MSTRGCIARVEGDGFRGVYNHFDSHPDSLGKLLFRLAQGADLHAMLHELIDEHPAGWVDLRKECLCHKARPEEALSITDQENSEWIEWAYAFDADARTMGVLHHIGGPRWLLCAVVPLDGPEPDWKPILAKGRGAAGGPID